MQDVDGLKPSEYLYDTAKRNIDGEITIDEVDELIRPRDVCLAGGSIVDY